MNKQAYGGSLEHAFYEQEITPMVQYQTYPPHIRKVQPIVMVNQSPISQGVENKVNHSDVGDLWGPNLTDPNMIVDAIK